ncbi:MAG TPA: Xaa-Pro peptidase family protein [Sedimentisphaerales bacterium]|nr:Xaa-Pro peptidase family protein [Sedimentisphaerales bacterium]
MRKEAISSRLALLRKAMRGQGLDWLILASPANVTYMTGFMGGDSWAVVGRRKICLLTDSRYTEEANRDCAGCEIIERTDSMTKTVCGIVGAKGSVGADVAMSLAFYEPLRKALKGRLRTAGRIVEGLREVKSSGEVRLIREAASIAWKVLQKSLIPAVGISETELAGRIEFEMRRLGASPSFDTIVAFGSNASQVHYRPANRRLRANDTILIDFGIRWKGYCCDVTRCYAVGEAGRLYRKAYDAVLEAHKRAAAMVRAGASVRELDAVARKVIADAGLPPYGHGLGHGLGLEIHEGPVVSSKSQAKLKAGQVITIEPGVYIPGRLGIRIENDYLVTENGCRLLTGGPKRYAIGPLQTLAVR